MLSSCLFAILLISFYSSLAVPITTDNIENIEGTDYSDSIGIEDTDSSQDDCKVDEKQLGFCIVYYRCNYTAPDVSVKTSVNQCRHYLYVCCPNKYIMEEKNVPIPNQAVLIPKVH